MFVEGCSPNCGRVTGNPESERIEGDWRVRTRFILRIADHAGVEKLSIYGYSAVSTKSIGINHSHDPCYSPRSNGFFVY
jgi:hypothetical protein